MIGIIKLTSGEELVGEVKGLVRKGTSTSITNPLKIIYKQSIDGIPITFVQRYQMFTKNPTLQIYNEHIISMSEARDSFIEYYRDAVKHYEQTEGNIDKQLSLMSGEETSETFESILQNMPKGTIN